MFSRVLCLLTAGILMAQTPANPKDTARKALDLLLAGKYSDMAPLFAPTSKAANSDAVLAKKVSPAWGAVQSVGVASLRALGTSSLVTIPVKFAAEEVSFIISINEQGQLGLINTAIDPWKHPAYSKADSFKDRDVTIGTQYKLTGTLSVPTGAGPFPGVVLVHDAGPGDRDESVGAVKVFKDVAEGLASRGVVVLRYEKRTRAYPSVAQTREYNAEVETIDDAVLAAAILRAQPEVKQGRVFALGFGFGGYLLPRMAEADGKLAGMVIVNGNERPLEDLAMDEAQYRGITGPQLVVIQEQIAKIKKLTQGDEDTVALLNKQGPYWLDLKDYNAAGQAKMVAVPLLILQGERDFQVNMKDFAAWKTGLQGVKSVTMKSYPALDHLMVTGTGKSTDADYRKQGQHVDQQVIDDIAKWLTQ